MWKKCDPVKSVPSRRPNYSRIATHCCIVLGSTKANRVTSPFKGLHLVWFILTVTRSYPVFLNKQNMRFLCKRFICNQFGFVTMGPRFYFLHFSHILLLEFTNSVVESGVTDVFCIYSRVTDSFPQSPSGFPVAFPFLFTSYVSALRHHQPPPGCHPSTNLPLFKRKRKFPQTFSLEEIQILYLEEIPNFATFRWECERPFVPCRPTADQGLLKHKTEPLAFLGGKLLLSLKVFLHMDCFSTLFWKGKEQSGSI